MARKKKSELLKAEDVLEKFRIAEEHWGLLHNEMEVDNQIFELALPVKAPNGYNVIYPDTGRTIVMTAADHVAGNSPQVKVPEAGLLKPSEDRSERLEGGLQAALYRAQAALQENPIRTLVINGLWSGMMVAQGPLFDGDAWGLEPVESEYGDGYKEAKDEYDTNKKVTWPFLWRAVDPRYVFPDPGTTGKKWVIVHYQRTAGSIKEQWPEWSGKLKGSSESDKPVPENTLLQWYEYWDEKVRVYMVGTDIIDQREHRYCKPPFQIRAAGYGNDSALPHRRFRSILWPARSLITAQIGAWSHRDALIRRTAWTQMLAPKNSGFDSLEPGTIKELDREVLADPNLIRAVSEINPVAIQAVDGEIASLDYQIQKATFPDVVQGIRAKGIQSGYGQNSLVAQAKVKYGTVAVNLQSLLEEMLVDLAHCVSEVVEEDVPVWGHTKWGRLDDVLKVSDCKGLRYIVVTINPKLPAERANEIEMGGVLLDRGVIDNATYLQDFVGYENPGEMQIRVLKDRALNSPEIQRVLAFAAALKGGYLDYVMDQATSLGIDPAALLSVLGFGNPSQQAPAANQGAGAPQQVAAARQGNTATVYSGTQKSQPQPGTNPAVRDQVVPGVPIGG